MLSLSSCGKMNESIISSSLKTNLCVWFSSILLHLIEAKHANSCSVNSPTAPCRNTSHVGKTKACLVGGDDLSLLKSFTAQSFLYSFMACDKNWPFCILYEKYQISSYTTCLIRNSDTPMSLAMDLIDLLGFLSVMV